MNEKFEKKQGINTTIDPKKFNFSNTLCGLLSTMSMNVNEGDLTDESDTLLNKATDHEHEQPEAPTSLIG